MLKVMNFLSFHTINKLIVTVTMFARLFIFESHLDNR